jgi:ABC-type uncharacterized transport system auxiliary subunit
MVTTGQDIRKTRNSNAKYQMKTELRHYQQSYVKRMTDQAKI